MADHPTTPADRPDRSDPSTGSDRTPAPVDWSGIRGRGRNMQRWTERAHELAADHLADRRPGPIRRWWNRRRAQQLITRPVRPAASARSVPTARRRSGADRLRFIPPVAALGTAWVMQVIAVTDTLGTSLATNLANSPVPWLAERPAVGYLGALLLGIAVASCAEGGAAYLMDLYDKHLLARDSVGTLRLAMFAYVGASAGAIHWWAEYRGLPWVTSWLLAGMSGSALFLWSRGSRWRNRVAMREAGQLDPALPKLPAATKAFHPWRSLVALWSASWTPTSTTNEMRQRYETWAADREARRMPKEATADRSGRPRRRKPTAKVGPVEPTAMELWLEGRLADGRTILPVVPLHPTTGPVDDEPTTPLRSDRPRPASRPARSGRKPTGGSVVSMFGPTAVSDAAFLRTTYGDDLPGRNELWRRHGGNAGKWSAAIAAHRAGADRQPTARPPDQTGDAEEDSSATIDRVGATA